MSKAGAGELGAELGQTPEVMERKDSQASGKGDTVLTLTPLGEALVIALPADGAPCHDRQNGIEAGHFRAGMRPTAITPRLPRPSRPKTSRIA
ncbi:hypothetical protein [Mesobacterium pallidum]|uniref:hypothetical protein n=1 Tax=Mesobacterium pallidum TaxID=2872037 RepID=UPI001EE285EC|nr:hypothetical protein [Mesobacterium pallidum]